MSNDSINEKVTAGSNTSYWIESASSVSYSKLNSDLVTDAVIVGGGIAGLSVAYCLSKAGKRIILVEDGNIGSGETGRTSAHLVSALDDRYYELERMYGKNNTRLIAKSHVAAIDFIENTVKKEGIDCDFKRVDGYLFLHPTDDPESLEKEFMATREAGLDTDKVKYIPGITHYGNAIRFKNQAQFHPLKYIQGLANAVENEGGQIFTNTHASEINQEGIVTDNGFKIKADHIIVATNSPVNNKYVMHTKQFQYRTYIVGIKIRKGSLPAVLWWDTGDFSKNSEIPPYHYVRTQEFDDTHDLLIVGGEDHATGNLTNEDTPEEIRYTLLEEWARDHFSDLEEVACKWSGQVIEPMDSLAYIGKNPLDEDNIYIVTGDSGNGLTHGTLGGIIIRDLILGNENEWSKIYEPSRVKFFTAGKTFFKEFVGGLVTYLKSKPDAEEISSIENGQGKIVEIENKKYGAYRDENDALHIVSSECTHLQCTIRWNNTEKSWDCPCHGSRFTYEGKVMNGPANKPLMYYKVDRHVLS